MKATAAASNVKHDLVETCDYVWNRLRARLDGMTDEEYLWEPVPDCMTIRIGPDGSWTWDHVFPWPDPAPLTTIAWRLTHIAADRSTGDGGVDNRMRAWLGLPDIARPDPAIPTTADEARAAVERATKETHEMLMEATEASLWEPIGPIGHRYADATRVALVLHHLDEIVHHSAEIALMRDLYRVREGLGR